MYKALLAFTVALADRSALVRNMVDAVCERYGLQVVGEASTSWQLVALCQTRRPDLVVADSDLGDGPIEACIDRVLATGAKVVILCDDDSTERLTGLLERGVSGYLLHDSSPDHVGEGLLAVAAGAAALHPTVTDTILKQWRRFRLAGPSLSLSPRSTLTPRELDVLQQRALRSTNAAVAKELDITVDTVEVHLRSIRKKLCVDDTGIALLEAYKRGLIEY